jgi:hypothetical protein
MRRSHFHMIASELRTRHRFNRCHGRASNPLRYKVNIGQRGSRALIDEVLREQSTQPPTIIAAEF